jgi:bifunctional DNase/RNase
MLRMTIEGVGFDHLKQTVVVLKDWEGRKLLPIWIGPAEARSIAFEMEGATQPRPGAHDLLMICLQHSGARITRVVINDLQDATFYATIDIDTPGAGLLHIDSRPSDAIALAVRAKCPVFIDGGAIDALIDMSNEQSSENDAGTMQDDAAADELSEADLFADLSRAASSSSASPAPASPAATPPDEDIDRFKRLVGDLDL